MEKVEEKYKKFMFNRRFDESGSDIAEVESEIKDLFATSEDLTTDVASELENIITEAEPVKNDEPVYIPPTYTQEQLDEEIKKAKDEGISLGKKEFEKSAEKSEIDALLVIEKQISDIKLLIEQQSQQQETDFINLCKVMFKKLMPEMEKKYGFDEIESIIKQSMPKLTKEPRLKILINEALTPKLKEKLTDIVKKVGFLGKIVIQSNEDLKLSDIKIEWDKGGITRDSDIIMSEMDAVLDAYAGNKEKNGGE